MGTCMARRGFLTLSDCGNPATTMCGTCSRPVCAMHLSPTSGFTQCLDCAATNPQQQQEQTDQTEEQYDDEWAHRYRDDYYSSTSYRPFYSGTHTDDSYYSSQDVRSFDEDANDREFGADDEADTGGFEAS